MKLGAVLVLAAATPASLGAQAATVAGRVVGEEGAPLSFAVVALPRLGREQFTDDSGVFRIAGLPAGTTAVRVRRLGYAPYAGTLSAGAGAADTVRIVLRRLVVRLAAVHVREHPPCREPGPPLAERDTALAALFQQLQLNAGQLRTLGARYPFEYTMRARLSRVLRGGRTEEEGTEVVRMSSRDEWRYRPGRVLAPVSGRRRALEFHLPAIEALAEPAFIESHCFYRGASGQTPADTLHRIDFAAHEQIRSPDVNGSIYLDAATFQVRRMELQLSRMPPATMVRGMAALEVTAIFREVLPSIPVLQSVSSVQRFDPRVRGLRVVEAREEQVLESFRFTGRRPGDPEQRDR